MNAKDLIEIISDKTRFNLEDVEIVFNCFIEEIMNNNQLQKNIKISGFGTFKIKRVKSFTRIHHKTNNEHVVSKYKYIKFIPTKKYKKHIKTKPQLSKNAPA